MNRRPETGHGTAASARKRPSILGIAAVTAVVGLLIVAVRLLPVAAWLEAFKTWVQGYGFWSYALYALVYAVATVLFVPGSILTLGAGAIFGLWKGAAVVLVGASAGAIASFALARTVLRSRVEAMVGRNPRIRALDRAIGKEGGKIVFLVRLAPVFPFNFINYAFGLTGVRPLAYAVATIVGMIPGIFAYVYLGHASAVAATAASGDAAGGATSLAVNVGGALAALAVTIYVARIASRAIRQAGV